MSIVTVSRTKYEVYFQSFTKFNRIFAFRTIFSRLINDKTQRTKREFVSISINGRKKEKKNDQFMLI